MRQALRVGICWLWVMSAAQAAAPANIEVTTNTNTVIANFFDTATITAVVTDASHNPVPNQAVTISASGSNNGVARRTGTTDASGSFFTTIKSNVSQGKLVTVTTGLISGYASLLFVPGPPASSRCQVMASPKMALVADGISTSLLTVTVQDSFANPIADMPVTLSVGGSENSLSLQNGNSSDSGLFFSGLTSTHAETKTISAQIGNLTVSTNVTFVGNSPNQNFSKFIVTPNTTLFADQNQAFKLQVLVLDDHNNPIPNYPVAFGIDGTTARFDANDGYSTTAGVFSTSLRSSSIGVKQLYATAGEFSASSNVTFVVGVPRSSSSTVIASPNIVVANHNSIATVTTVVRDASGNPIPNLPVALAVNGNRNTLSASNGNTDVNGSLVVTLSSGAAETKTVTMTAGGATARGTVNFVAGSANATLSHLSVNPQFPIPANNSALFTMITTIVDDYANPVRLLPLSYASSGHNDTLTDSFNLTSNSGVAYNTLRSTSVGDSTISVVAGNLTLSANVTFTLGAMSTSASHLVASPNANVIADLNHPISLSATLRDIVGHVLANQNIFVTSNGAGDVLGATSGQTDANGFFSTTLKASKAGTKNISVSNGNQRISAIATFVAGAPNQLTSSVSIAPNNIIADGRSIASIETLVLDAFGNPVRGVPVTLVASDANTAFGSSNGVSNVTGVALTTLRSTLASAKTVTATFSGFSVSGNVTFVAGSPSAVTSVFTVSPNTNLLANNSDTANITAVLRDAYGNYTPRVRVLLVGQAVGNTFTPPTGLTDANGTFLSSVRASRAAAQLVTLSAGTATLNANVIFSPGPAVQAASNIERSPYAGVTANGSAVSTVTASLYDQWNNPIANTHATMSSSNANDVLSAASGNTTSLGTYATTIKSTQAGSRDITFTSGNVVLTIPVSFIAGSPNAANSSFVADSNNVAADNVSLLTMTATLRDSFHNPVSTGWVNFTASGSRYLFSPSGVSTDMSGVAQSTFRTASAGTRQLRATLGSFAMNTNVTFVAGSPNSNTTKVTASPNVNVPANGTTQVTLKALVFDVFANPVPSQAVTLSSNGNTDQIAAANGTTDANGVYTTTLTSSDAGVKTITLTAGSATATARVVHATPTAGAPEQAPSWRLADSGRRHKGQARPWLLVREPEGLATSVVAIAPGTEPRLVRWQPPAPERGGPWTERGSLPVPFDAALLASGDLDGDGHVDLLAADAHSGALLVVSDVSGEPSVVQNSPQVLFDRPLRALAVTGPSADGQQQAAALAPDGRQLNLYSLSARGTFTPTHSVALASPAEMVALSAERPDGAQVMAFGSHTGIDAYVREQGAPGWQRRDVSHDPIRWLGTADIDADGYGDVVALDEDGTRLWVWRGVIGGLSLERDEFTLPAVASAAALGDADGDGVVDVTVAECDGTMRLLDGWGAPGDLAMGPMWRAEHAPRGFAWAESAGGVMELVTFSSPDKRPESQRGAR